MKLGNTIAAALVAGGLVGCATTADRDALSARVGALEQQIRSDEAKQTALESNLRDVGAKADAAGARAAAAEQQATSAAQGAAESAQRADDAARRADAMFKKSVSK